MLKNVCSGAVRKARIHGGSNAEIFDKFLKDFAYHFKCLVYQQVLLFKDDMEFR